MYYYEPWMMRTQPKSNNSTNSNRLKVNGEGIVTTAPNSATITLGVITESSTVTEAQNENNQLTKKVIDSILGLGVPKEHIKTVDFRIEILYNYENSKQTVRGYRVTHMLQISDVAIQSVGSIVDTAVQNGANNVASINFTVRNPQAYYEKALQNAVQDAQEKARTITKKLGVQLQEIPLQIQELSQQSPPIPFQTTMFAKSEAATPIQPGELTITARIEATFLYGQVH
ncbi:SIMPL domain-containing protein [Bacillus sp. REN16]|uniref:SIMPL domain-containing protein n=1 Tax=Bacillus sp. REN16 TaxID=2887296 RepID=UPI001E327B26|nr:SIMPL domain-containing protein [Bacillus sp. REN16]MCC3355708.1 SIMPL domain-containing protein [Bacillus sp. REN16]